MSSKPKKQNYQASEQEKASAAVAQAEKKYFDEKYGPLLREMRDISEKEDLSAMARGRSQADTMQALSGKPSLAAARSVDQAADMASAASAQQIQASAQGLGAQRQKQVGVLGTARGQAADAQSGLAQAARIQSTKQLQEARAKQQIRDARFGAQTQLATTFGLQGAQNIAGGGSFFTPKDMGDSRLQYGMNRLGSYLGIQGPTNQSQVPEGGP
jgi:hypothetical protein